MRTITTNIFGKKRTTNDGRQFYTYLTTLKKADGEEVSCEVRFREECGNPKKVPCTISFDVRNANFSTKEVRYADTDTGEEKTTTRKTLWVSAYTESEYIDESMNDFI